jgi:DNA segregation ATPase FtsK/SpoIIIE, S-DNA-T family
MLPSEAAKQQQQLLAAYPAVVQQQVSLLTRRLLSFGFAGTFRKMVEGPVVRTYYFKAEGDSKFASVLNKEEEIAGALAVESVRIERELGDCTISVPREDRIRIEFDNCLHTMMTSPLTKDMALPLLMGQNTVGEALYADLASQPHLLIAGATNSGKSVYTAQLICSLALFRSPDELEFILVDTKNLDLVLFKGLNHVKYVLNNVTDLRAALQMLLEEVRLRNAEMSGLARNIREWNALHLNAAINIKTAKQMKYKVLIVDELADVFMQDEALLRPYPKKERPPSIEFLIQQISQISRAAGVHLVLATQRPSVDILPGTIKNNFPARVCFKVPARVDSRVVLDADGAENLLGMGDYLYKIAGSDTVKRAHSAFVSMNSIANIIAQNDMIRRQYASTRE